MTDYKKIFIDTAPFIYFIEKNQNNPQYFEKMKTFFDFCFNNDIEIITSTITIEEYMVYPYKLNQLQYINSFENLLNVLNTQILDINKSIAQKAAQIRAKYTSFRAMDALQLATAIISNSDLFLTNDKQITQYSELKCMTVDELDSLY